MLKMFFISGCGNVTAAVNNQEIVNALAVNENFLLNYKQEANSATSFLNTTVSPKLDIKINALYRVQPLNIITRAAVTLSH